MNKPESNNLNQQFILELFKCCLTSNSILELTIAHMEYEYLPNKFYKTLFEKIKLDYDLSGTSPTLGMLYQYFNSDEKILEILHKIKNTDVTEKRDSIVTGFEKFLIGAKFVNLYNKIGLLYNEGKKEDAIITLGKESIQIAEFSIKDSYYSGLFSDSGFEKRQEIRQQRIKDPGIMKIPYSIHPLDYYTKGGMSRGTSICFLGRSGAGKSTLKRWVGLSAARLGFKVVHFQAEGTEQECYDAYDAAWTSINLEDMEFGNIPEDKVKAIMKAHKDILSRKGDVFVKASETFDELSLNDCKDIMLDIVKIHGPIDLGIFDYAELFALNKKYMASEAGERKRREDIANKITSLATMFNMASLTSTQANDIRPEKWNDPNFVMTRSDISEFKGFVKPFSAFITINQTEDEYESGVIRLHNDKFRKYFSGQTYTIAQSLNNSRFYDSKRTLELFWDDKSNSKKGMNLKE
jgi:KaiC/GvpD/RAD55 family RecA-like ATPase